MTNSRIILTVVIATLAIAVPACSSHPQPRTGAATDPSAQRSSAPAIPGPSSSARSSSATIGSATTDPSSASGQTRAAPTSTAATARPRTPSTQAYLDLARTAYPGSADATLASMGRRICAQRAHGSSPDDLTGDLAAQLGNQALAYRIIAAATAAYCP